MFLCRDRDAPVTKEGIIFRVLGYDHPPNACICDVEYAPASIYQSQDPRAPRGKSGAEYYKFYFDQGLNFVKKRFPQYQVYSYIHSEKLVGLYREHIYELRRPDEKLRSIYYSEIDDPLLNTMRKVLDNILDVTSLKLRDFGVFGSLLHGFYSVKYSDLDFIIYGSKQLLELIDALFSLYKDPSSGFMNEYCGSEPPDSRYKRFRDYHVDEYMWHQKRKMIYGVYRRAWRPIKVEFEPVKRYEEIKNEYPMINLIRKIEMVEAIVEVIDSSQSYFMPSIYYIEVLDSKDIPSDVDVKRIVSFVEEFRMQLKEGERGFVRGWLEEVEKKNGEVFYQITLSYCPQYSQLILKSINNG